MSTNLTSNTIAPSGKVDNLSTQEASATVVDEQQQVVETTTNEGTNYPVQEKGPTLASEPEDSKGEREVKELQEQRNSKPLVTTRSEHVLKEAPKELS